MCSNKHNIQFRGHNYTVLSFPITELQSHLYAAQLTVLHLLLETRRECPYTKKSESYLAEEATN